MSDTIINFTRELILQIPKVTGKLMINLQVTDLNFFYAFWLVFCRWGAMMLQFPLFDQNTIPLMVKVLLIVGFSFAIFPMLQGVVVRDVVLVGAENIWFLTIFYTLMGLLVGFFIQINSFYLTLLVRSLPSK